MFSRPLDVPLSRDGSPRCGELPGSDHFGLGGEEGGLSGFGVSYYLDVPSFGYPVPWHAFNIPSLEATVGGGVSTQLQYPTTNPLHLVPPPWPQHLPHAFGYALPVADPQQLVPPPFDHSGNWGMPSTSMSGFDGILEPILQPLATTPSPLAAEQFDNNFCPLFSEIPIPQNLGLTLDATFPDPLVNHDQGLSPELQITSLGAVPELSFSVSSASPAVTGPSAARSPSAQAVATNSQPESPERWVCENCPKTFETRAKRRQHQRYHTLRFHCLDPGCGKRFATQNDLDRHRNKTPLPCPFPGCGSVITGRKDNLNRHIKDVHEGEMFHS